MTPDETIRKANQLRVEVGNEQAEVGSRLHSLSLLVESLLEGSETSEFKAIGDELHQASLHLAASLGTFEGVLRLIQIAQDTAQAAQKKAQNS